MLKSVANLLLYLDPSVGDGLESWTLHHVMTEYVEYYCCYVTFGHSHYLNISFFLNNRFFQQYFSYIYIGNSILILIENIIIIVIYRIVL